MDPILVTGATGRVGRLVVSELLAMSAPVRALTRRPAVAALPAGVQVVAGDLTIPESLDSALDGIDSAFLVWTAGPASAPAVIERLAARARRIVLLSSPHQTPHPFFQQPNPLAALHASLDRTVAMSGVPWTIVRPGMFASNAVMWWGEAIRKNRSVRWPFGLAETAPIDERDIAAVAARSLVEHGHAGQEYVLTGPESLTQAEQVKRIGAAIGTAIAFEEVAPDEFRSDVAAQWPPAAVDMLLAAWQATLGLRAYITSTVEHVVGSPARTFDQWAADHAAAFHQLP